MVKLLLGTAIGSFVTLALCAWAHGKRKEQWSKAAAEQEALYRQAIRNARAVGRLEGLVARGSSRRTETEGPNRTNDPGESAIREHNRIYGDGDG